MVSPFHKIAVNVEENVYDDDICGDNDGKPSGDDNNDVDNDDNDDNNDNNDNDDNDDDDDDDNNGDDDDNYVRPSGDN